MNRDIWFVLVGLLVGPLGCQGNDGGTCARLAEEDASCAALPDTPGFHVCEDDSQKPPNDACVSLGDTGDYCCPLSASGKAPAGEGLDPSVLPRSGSLYQPDSSTAWQWQISGDVNPGYAVDVYDIDLFDVEAATIAELQASGKHVFCYFSAGSSEDWRPDFGDFAPSARGKNLEGWEGEQWLDVTDPTVLDVALARLDLAVSKGCDGVEPDNVDGYQNNTGFALTADHQLGFNKRIANEAHARGLAVLLKNDLAQIPELVDFYDGALNEECFAYDECDQLLPFTAASKPVFNAEYVDSQRQAAPLAEDICARATDANLRTLILPWDLDDSFRLSCDEP